MGTIKSVASDIYRCWYLCVCSVSLNFVSGNSVSPWSCFGSNQAGTMEDEAAI